MKQHWKQNIQRKSKDSWKICENVINRTSPRQFHRKKINNHKIEIGINGQNVSKERVEVGKDE